MHHYLGHAYVALKDVYRPPQAAADEQAAADDSSGGWVGQHGGLGLKGARRNFALVQGVVASLGGIPAMVSGEALAVEHDVLLITRHRSGTCLCFEGALVMQSRR